MSETNVIRDKIIGTLSRYPKLSPSMLHTGIGPAIPSSIWQPELEKLIAEGKVVRTENEVQSRKYTTLELAPTLHTIRQV